MCACPCRSPATAYWDSYGVQYDHKYTNTSQATAAAVLSAGLDVEDADSPQKLAFAGLADAVRADASGYVGAMVNHSNFRLFYIRMRLGEFDPPASNPYRQIPTSVINSPAHLQLSQEAARKVCHGARASFCLAPPITMPSPSSSLN